MKAFADKRRPLMTVAGERANLWERDTWPVLEDLARNHPEAGIHFQQLKLFVREQDVGTAKAKKWVEPRAIIQQAS